MITRKKFCEFLHVQVRAKMPVTKDTLNLAKSQCDKARVGDDLVATGNFPVVRPAESIKAVLASLQHPCEITSNATMDELVQAEAYMFECYNNMRRLRESLCGVEFKVQV